jgi:hypothetical protein
LRKPGQQFNCPTYDWEDRMFARGLILRLERCKWFKSLGQKMGQERSIMIPLARIRYSDNLIMFIDTLFALHDALLFS